MKKHLKRTSLPVICVILAVAAAFLIVVRFQAKSSGEALGRAAGAAAGRAVGSFEGITTGTKEGKAAGTAKGLSAEDTTIILNAVRKVQKLQVLIYSGNVTGVVEIGDENDSAELYSMKFQVVYTVDLETASVEKTENGFLIHLDPPTPEFQSENPKRLAEYREWHSTGSTKRGITEYANVKDKLKEKAEEDFAQDDLQEAARESAEKQIEELIHAAQLSDTDVTIDFDWRASNG